MDRRFPVPVIPFHAQHIWELDLSSPKPGHTAARAARNEARQGGGARRGEADEARRVKAGRDGAWQGGAVRPEDNRPFRFPRHRRLPSWTTPSEARTNEIPCKLNPSSPKPGHTTGGSGRVGAAHSGAAGRGGLGRVGTPANLCAEEPANLFAEETSDSLALQGFDDNCGSVHLNTPSNRIERPGYPHTFA